MPYPIPAANEALAYAITVRTSNKGDFELELTFDARGTWTLAGERELEAAIGKDLFSDWLINFWHHNPLGRHVWALGNRPMRHPGETAETYETRLSTVFPWNGAER